MDQQLQREDWAILKVSQIAEALSLSNEAIERAYSVAGNKKELLQRALDFRQVKMFEKRLKEGHSNSLQMLDEAFSFFEHFARHDDVLRRALDNRNNPVFLEMRVFHDILRKDALSSEKGIMMRLKELMDESERIQNKHLKEKVKQRIAAIIRLVHMQQEYARIVQEAQMWQQELARNRDPFPFAKRLSEHIGKAKAFRDETFAEELGKNPAIQHLGELTNPRFATLPLQIKKIEDALLDLGKDYQIEDDNKIVTPSNPLYGYIHDEKMKGIPLFAYLSRELKSAMWRRDRVTKHFVDAALRFANTFRTDFSNNDLADQIEATIKVIQERPDQIMMFLAKDYDALQAEHQGIAFNGVKRVAEARNSLIYAFMMRIRHIDYEIIKEVQLMQQEVQKALYGKTGEELLALLERAITKAWVFRRKVLYRKKKELEMKAEKLRAYADKVLDVLSMEGEATWLSNVTKTLKHSSEKVSGMVSQPAPPAHASSLFSLAEYGTISSKADEGKQAIARNRTKKIAYGSMALRVLGGRYAQSLFLEYLKLFNDMGQLIELQEIKLAKANIGGIGFQIPKEAPIALSQTNPIETLKEAA